MMHFFGIFWNCLRSPMASSIEACSYEKFRQARDESLVRFVNFAHIPPNNAAPIDSRGYSQLAFESSSNSACWRHDDGIFENGLRTDVLDNLTDGRTSPTNNTCRDED